MSEYTHEYDSWKEQIRQEIEAWEGEGPPKDGELWNHVAFQAEATAGWVRDMAITEENIETARGELLMALVALEMLMERKKNNE